MQPEMILANASAVYAQFISVPCERLADDLFDRHVGLLRRYCDMTGASMRDVARSIAINHLEQIGA